MYPNDFVTWFVGVDCGVDQAIWSLKDQRVVAVDTETTGLKTLESSLVLLQIAGPGNVFVFPMQELRYPCDNSQRVEPVQPCALPDEIKALLENPEVTKLMQYAPFDWGFIQHHLGINVHPIWDTKAAAKGLYPDEPSGLGALVEKHLGVTMDDKEHHALTFVGKEPPFQMTERALQYAADDAAALFPLALHLALHGCNHGMVFPTDLLLMHEYLRGSAPFPERR